MINNFKKIYNKIKTYSLNHKKISSVAIVVIVIILYISIKSIFGSETVTAYTIGEVQKGNVSTYITGSGQVSSSNEIELKSKASGDILKVNVTTGQEVKSGTIIAQIDDPDAYINYRSAQIAYEKMLNSDEVSKIQALNNLNDTRQSLAKSSDNLNNAYDNAFNTMASSYVNLSEVINGIDSMLYSKDGFLSYSNMYTQTAAAQSYKESAGKKFDQTKDSYQTTLQEYRSLSRLSATSSFDTSLKNTYSTLKKTSDVLKDLKNTVDFIKNQDVHNQNSSEITTASNSLISWISKINSDLSSLSSAINNINDLRETVKNAPQLLAQQEASYKQSTTGGTLDIEAQALNLEQKRLAYQNIFIRAPFDGVIAKLDVKKSDEVSSGTVIGTIITKDKVADITVNEVDAAKIKMGQKATLTFDAIEDLSITGVVQSIDLVGTVTQGVVNYNVKITFDVQDERIKSGMSVSASIITENKQDVLVVPNNAIKSKNGIKYVELFDKEIATSTTPQVINKKPIQQTVEIGISGDVLTEIISGLALGDKISIKTSSTNAKSAKTSSAPSLFGTGTNKTGASTGATMRAMGR